jgi:hypothetical protein
VSPARIGCAALLALAGLSSGCAPGSSNVQTATIAQAHEPPAPPYPEPAEQWGAYRSARFRLSIPLPSPRAWRVDDSSRAELVATEASTRSTLTVLSESEPALMNHQLCEERARTLGLVADGALQTIEDAVTVGPAEYDTRVRVGVERGHGAERKLVGHLFAFGGHVRKCLVIHLATEVASEDDEQTLSQRLALARLRTLGGLKVAEIGIVPRGKNPP